MATRASALPPEERRAAIVAATLPLLFERGANVSTRQIAEAAGIAEGTIFAVFPDKEAVLQAALRAALDPEPTERELAAIDRTLPFKDQLTDAVGILQRRVTTIWRVLSGTGDNDAPRTPPADFASLVDILSSHRDELRTDPLNAARQLRALTVAVSHPMFFTGDPMDPRQIVELFLDGARVKDGRRPRRGDRT